MIDKFMSIFYKFLLFNNSLLFGIKYSLFFRLRFCIFCSLQSYSQYRLFIILLNKIRFCILMAVDFHHIHLYSKFSRFLYHLVRNYNRIHVQVLDNLLTQVLSNVHSFQYMAHIFKHLLNNTKLNTLCIKWS